MAVRIRLKRAGRRHLPFYHIGIFDIEQKRDGAAIERIGSYAPLEKDDGKQVTVNVERAAYWLGQGASASETVAAILKKAGCALPEKKKAESRTRKPRVKAEGVKARTKRRTTNSKTRAAKRTKD